ncbi:MAG: DUF2953 domain-containing protein [Methanocellales archaeon]
MQLLLFLFIIFIFAIILFLILFLPIDLDFEIISTPKKKERKYFISWHIFRRQISIAKKESNVERKFEFKLEYLEFMGPIFGFIQEAKRSLVIKDFTLSIYFGTSNPAYTGMIFGYLSALQYAAMEMFPKISFNISSDFSKERFDYYSKGSISLKPYLLLSALIKFMLRKPIRTLIKNEISRKLTIHRKTISLGT